MWAFGRRPMQHHEHAAHALDVVEVGPGFRVGRRLNKRDVGSVVVRRIVIFPVVVVVPVVLIVVPPAVVIKGGEVALRGRAAVVAVRAEVAQAACPGIIACDGTRSHKRSHTRTTE